MKMLALLTAAAAAAAESFASGSVSRYEFGSLPKKVYYDAPAPLEAGSACELAAVVVHGYGGGVELGWETVPLMNALAAACPGKPAPYVVAPLFPRRQSFKIAKAEMDDRARWNDSWSGNLAKPGVPDDDFRGGGDAVGTHISSFEIVDGILLALGDRTRYPNLKRVIVTGFSAGGQFVGRYAAVGKGFVRDGVEVVYAAMAPSTEFRFERGETWHYGLANRPRYAAAVTEEQIMRNLASRRVWRACGSADNDPSSGQDNTPAAMRQGGNRYERFLNFEKYLAKYPEWAKQVSFHTFEGLGHDTRKAHTDPAFVAFATGNGGAVPAAPFAEARPVWAAGREREMNSNVRFKAEFPAEGRCVLRIAGASAYRIRLDGKHAGYGPARGPKGFFRVDEWPLETKKGKAVLEIDAVGYNCNSFQFMDESAFLQAEVVAPDGRILAATGRGRDFAASSTERVRRVHRYSFQRTFSEVYRFGPALEEYPLSVLPQRRLLDRIAPYPDFPVNSRVVPVSRAAAAIDKTRKIKNFRFLVPSEQNRKIFKCFRPEELEENQWAVGEQTVFSGRRPAEPAYPFELSAGESAMLDAGLNDCGFFGLDVEVKKPGRLYFSFDEILADGEVDSSRNGCCNVIEWIFEKPGRYSVETLEPYVWRYGNLFTFDGAVSVLGAHVRAYKNPRTGRAKFRSSDKGLEKVFEAARETFAQNAVDVFTDCPSRERAGWLCDSFFIGRVNRLLTGDTDLERLFLQNFALPESFDDIPQGMVPMCYPADHTDKKFIPNWAMWLILETDEYLRRSGDRATVDALRPRLCGIVEYLNGFENGDGLLEKLPSWVFVEWSMANKLVMDVNYPSNMAWAEVLDAMDRLYGIPEYAAKAKAVRDAVLRQSWNGRWFCDNAVRGADGKLRLSGECTETCQYYAFFFKTATPETHPELWRTLVRDFGPKRAGENGAPPKLHPEIHPSNAFIGNYLRLECLSREGLSAEILEETKGYFLYMAERTGTLWEMISPTASCDHGFASHVAVSLYRDVLGIREIDTAGRTVRVDPPRNLPLGWCEGEVPVSPDGAVKVAWRRGADGKISTETSAPSGWKVLTLPAKARD